MTGSRLLLQSATGAVLAGQKVPPWQTEPRALHAGTTRPLVSLHNVTVKNAMGQATGAIRSCGLLQLLPDISVPSCDPVSMPVQVSTPAAMTARWDC